MRILSGAQEAERNTRPRGAGATVDRSEVPVADRALVEGDAKDVSGGITQRGDLLGIIGLVRPYERDQETAPESELPARLEHVEVVALDVLLDLLAVVIQLAHVSLPADEPPIERAP